MRIESLRPRATRGACVRSLFERSSIFVGQPIVKPTGFITASTTAGFNLNWAF
jgi:hypothetical protein